MVLRRQKTVCCKKVGADLRILKKIHIVLFCIILVTISSGLSTRADTGDDRTIYLSGTEYDYPPFSVTDKGEADGFSVELLKAVAEEMGIVVTFKIDQWTVLKEELKNGELDILPLVGYTEERDEVYDFTVPYIVMRGNIFVRKGNDDIQSQEDLFDKDILVLDGDNSQEWARSIGLDSELTATATYLEAFELLSSGQYDAVLAQGLVGEKLISDHGLDNVEPVYVYDDGGVTRQKLNLEGYEQKFCFAVIEGDSELLSILNEGLSIVSVNGTYDELYQKWFPFLLEDQGMTTAEVIRYVAYILTPIIVLLIVAYFIMTRRTIRIKTNEIKDEKERSETYLNDLILSGRIFETSIKNAPVPIMIHAEDGSVLNISQAWINLTKYDKDDILTIDDWTEQAYGAKKESVRQFIDQLYSLTEVQHDGEFEVRTKDNRILLWDFHSVRIGKLPDGRAVAMSAANDVTARKEMETTLKQSEMLLRESKERFETLFNNAPLGYQSLDTDGYIREVNQTWLDLLGYRIEEVAGKWFGDFLTEKCKDLFKARFELFKDLGKIKTKFEMIHKNQEVKSIEFEGMIGFDSKGKFKQTYCILNDVTERDRFEQERNQINEQIAESEKKYRLLTTQMPLGLALHEVICDDSGKPIDFRFIDVNDSWETVMGVKKEVVLGNRVMELFPNTEEYWIDLYGKVAITGKPIRFENYASELDKYLLSNVYSPDPGYFAVIVEDITQRTKAEKELKYLSTHDVLTGLTNRDYFSEQLIQLDKAENRPISVISFDINGLVIINEAFGYNQGNEFIRFVSGSLQESFSEDDVISRISGDEFAVIMINTSSDQAREQALKLAQTIKSYNYKEVGISVAFGIATKTDSEDISKLLLLSENDMLSSKLFDSQSHRNQSIQAIIKAYNEKNPREEAHTQRVSDISERFGIILGMSNDNINKLKAISHLHDIGKIAIDEGILNKPGKLTVEEWEIIKKHPEIGARIISSSNEYALIAEDILAHHERFDGKGYPKGISGKDIPLRARIISIVDSYDAMTSDRPYRKAMTHKEAVNEIIKCAGTQFDPELVDIFINEVVKEESIKS